MFEFLTDYWKYKVEREFQTIAVRQSKIERKKIVDTMIALSKVNELTPERFGFFMEILSNQEMGENDVQRYILSVSSTGRRTKK